jgi:hypothetical protein
MKTLPVVLGRLVMDEAVIALPAPAGKPLHRKTMARTGQNPLKKASTGTPASLETVSVPFGVASRNMVNRS